MTGQTQPAIVLVEPQLGENIGMAARAMANFGLASLRLVKPRDGWPSEKARAAASRADAVIDSAIVYQTPADAVADMNYIVATTARARDGFKPVLSPVEAAREMRARTKAGQHCAILFGREKFGLFNEEVALADAIVTFPVDPDFSSLNIAQAVLLMSYEWMKTGLAAETDTNFRGPDMTPARREALVSLTAWMETALDARGYFRPEDKKPKMLDNLIAVLTRPGFTQSEIAVLRGALTSLDAFHPRQNRTPGEKRTKGKAP